MAHDVNEILQVWRDHFSKLGTPVESDTFNQDHFERVNLKIVELEQSRDIDDFTRDLFTEDEVRKCISLLNSGKAPGLDGITKEHIVNAGPRLICIITRLFNWILETEVIPVNFRRGVQIPLYKGKNTSTMDVNNYRGITLLSTFNKLFEVAIWKRMEGWWNENRAISNLQGACRKGILCVHSAYLLQESISTLLQTHPKVFVMYLDVSKAFDGVQIGGYSTDYGKLV